MRWRLSRAESNSYGEGEDRPGMVSPQGSDMRERADVDGRLVERGPADSQRMKARACRARERGGC